LYFILSTKSTDASCRVVHVRRSAPPPAPRSEAGSAARDAMASTFSSKLFLTPSKKFVAGLRHGDNPGGDVLRNGRLVWRGRRRFLPTTNALLWTCVVGGVTLCCACVLRACVRWAAGRFKHAVKVVVNDRPESMEALRDLVSRELHVRCLACTCPQTCAGCWSDLICAGTTCTGARGENLLHGPKHQLFGGGQDSVGPQGHVPAAGSCAAIPGECSQEAQELDPLGLHHSSPPLFSLLAHLRACNRSKCGNRQAQLSYG
jgi:hypothetical protein